MKYKYKTREQWLMSLADRLNIHLFDKKMPRYRVACGWPSEGGLAKKNRVVGECWYPSNSKDKTTEIIISISLADDLMDIADTLAHEMCHAILGSKAGHGPKFKALATSIGLVGKMTATEPGPVFIEKVTPILKAVGPYPHAALTGSKGKKQSTRLIKCECQECGYNVRITRKWLDEVGEPHCPEHGEMTEATP